MRGVLDEGWLECRGAEIELTSTLTPSLSFEGVPAPSSAVVVVTWDTLDLRGMARAAGCGWE